ncbi:nucleoside deaminase [Rhodocytophaga aerolata]|uniref:Nucleoside deaminase n=1 Tax=Rhodocytophaga aerolata TaxID=455078 RepID=A0ABT8RB68_9BACT|nr:nucleoside deaminase [Rhodocytophaga aerolata]MDO1447955.1 nucleoside deaminase [Rhodocytophaga aerolata]
MTKEEIEKYMREAIRLSREGAESGKGGPFGAVIVKDTQVVGKGSNQVLLTNDPTAHAEVVAIRNACATLQTFHLEECILFTSCEPCPMCLGAIYWARIRKIYYANTRKDAATIGFNDDFIYCELDLPIEERHIPMEPLLRQEALQVFQDWEITKNKKLY